MKKLLLIPILILLSCDDNCKCLQYQTASTVSAVPDGNGGVIVVPVFATICVNEVCDTVKKKSKTSGSQNMDSGGDNP